MSRLLSPTEAAQELCVSEKQLRALTCAGHIRYINIGLGEKRETRRYELADLQAFKSARGTSCQSIKGQGKTRTATTSDTGVIDFLDQLAARRKGKPSGSRRQRNSESKAS